MRAPVKAQQIEGVNRLNGQSRPPAKEIEYLSRGKTISRKDRSGNEINQYVPPTPWDDTSLRPALEVSC